MFSSKGFDYISVDEAGTSLISVKAASREGAIKGLESALEELRTESEGEDDESTAKTFDDENDPADGIKLKCGLVLAREDYWEIDYDGGKKTEFSQYEAVAIAKKSSKWRCPTMAEWAQIVEEIGHNKDGDITGQALHNKLGLGDDNTYRVYWSSTVQSSSYGYCLNFNFDNVHPAGLSLRYNRRSVRCVAKGGEE